MTVLKLCGWQAHCLIRVRQTAIYETSVCQQHCIRIDRQAEVFHISEKSTSSRLVETRNTTYIVSISLVTSARVTFRCHGCCESLIQNGFRRVSKTSRSRESTVPIKYNMQKYLDNAVDKYCAVSNLDRSKLRKVATPFVVESSMNRRRIRVA